MDTVIREEKAVAVNCPLQTIRSLFVRIGQGFERMQKNLQPH